MSNILVLRSFVSKVQLSWVARRRVQYKRADMPRPLPKGGTLTDYNSFIGLAFSV